MQFFFLKPSFSFVLQSNARLVGLPRSSDVASFVFIRCVHLACRNVHESREERDLGSEVDVAQPTTSGHRVGCRSKVTGSASCSLKLFEDVLKL